MTELTRLNTAYEFSDLRAWDINPDEVVVNALQVIQPKPYSHVVHGKIKVEGYRAGLRIAPNRLVWSIARFIDEHAANDAATKKLIELKGK